MLDMPFIKRWLLVNRVIVPRRKHYSAEHYQKIQMAEGSPLLVYTRRFAAGLANELSDDYVIEIGMRYGNPSIQAGLANLKKAGVDRIVAAPLYPQYTQSSFQTAVVETKKQAKKLGLTDKLKFVDPFYVDPGFIEAWAQDCQRTFRDTLSRSPSVQLSWRPCSSYQASRHRRLLPKQRCVLRANRFSESELLSRAMPRDFARRRVKPGPENGRVHDLLSIAVRQRRMDRAFV